jgi:hypothetical protein
VATEIVSNDAVGLNLVHLGQAVANVILGDGGAVRVQDLDDLNAKNQKLKTQNQLPSGVG